MYEKIKDEVVNYAYGVSTIIGKGTDRLLFDDGITVQAYHSPKFSTNIISVGKICEKLNILFTSDRPAHNGVRTCFIYKRETKKIVYEAKIKNKLYHIEMQRPEIIHTKRTASACVLGHQDGFKNLAKKVDQASERCGGLGNQSSERFMKLMNMFNGIPRLSTKTIQNMVCNTCLSAKPKRAPVSSSSII